MITWLRIQTFGKRRCQNKGISMNKKMVTSLQVKLIEGLGISPNDAITNWQSLWERSLRSDKFRHTILKTSRSHLFLDPIVGIIKTILRIISCQFWKKLKMQNFSKILKSREEKNSNTSFQNMYRRSWLVTQHDLHYGVISLLIIDGLTYL